MAKKKLKIMVSSTVFGSHSDLEQISVVLKQSFGYDVIMSKEGSVYVPLQHISNPEAACLEAVEDCDIFLGIIFPRYGSGITHKEFSKAVELNKPRLFLAHEKVEYLRKLFEPYLFDEFKERTDFELKKNTVLDSIKVVDMYNCVRSNWIQTFSNIADILYFIDCQFKDYKKRESELKAQSK